MNHAAYTARILFVSLIAPLLVAAAALIVTFSIAAALPARIAVHWDLAGHPNGYGSPYEFPIGIAATCLPLIAIFGGAVILMSHRGPLTPLLKILAVSSVWVTLVVSLTFISALLDRSVAQNLGLVLVTAFGIATVVGAGAWFALPPGVRGLGGRVRAAVPAVELAPSERASWIRTTSATARMVWFVVGLCGVLAAATILTTIATAGQYWALSFIPIVVLLVVVSNLVWKVRVDGNGVLVRSVIGVPVFRIPLDEITSADVIDVMALSEYGGFGVRWALNGRVGVIVRSGEALEVHRRKGLDLVVTIDDASTAAALINGLVERAPASA